MWSPDPGTRYDCGRTVGHRGLHLDDSQNTLFTTEWNPEREIPLITGPGTEPPAIEQDTVLGALPQILALLRERLPSPPPPVCGQSNDRLYPHLNCDLPLGHHGRHSSGITSWPRDPELCGRRIPFTNGVTCAEAWGHDGQHRSADIIAGHKPIQEQEVCGATLHLGNEEYRCGLVQGHDGMHQDSDVDRWDITGL